jgi:hypothetical protein
VGRLDGSGGVEVGVGGDLGGPLLGAAGPGPGTRTRTPADLLFDGAGHVQQFTLTFAQHCDCLSWSPPAGPTAGEWPTIEAWS